MATVTTSIDAARVVSMIDVASRDTTHEGEAINALRLVRRDLKRAGIDLVNVIHLNSKGTNGVVRETIAMLRQQTIDMQTEIAAKTKEIHRLNLETTAKETEIQRLSQLLRETTTDLPEIHTEIVSDTSEMSPPPPTPTTTDTSPKEFYTWIEFHNAGTAHLGKSKGFQQMFFETYTEYDGGDMSKWRRTDKVPARAMELIATMPIVVNPERGKDWTDTEKEFLRVTLTNDPKITMADLTTKLCNEFNRYFPIGGVKAAKSRLMKGKA